MAKNALKAIDPRGQALVSALLEHGDIAKAAADCGMPESEAKALVRKPDMRGFLLMEYSQTLIETLAPMAIKNIRAMLQGDAKPDRGMIALCKTVLDRVGQPIAGSGQDTAPMESWSMAELQAFIAEKAANMPDVTPRAPVTIDVDPQLSDLLD